MQSALNCTDFVTSNVFSALQFIWEMCRCSAAILLLCLGLIWGRTACFLLCYIKHRLEKTKPKAAFLSKQCQFHNFSHRVDIYWKKEHFNIMKRKVIWLNAFLTVCLYSDSIDCIARMETLKNYFFFPAKASHRKRHFEIVFIKPWVFLLDKKSIIGFIIGVWEVAKRMLSSENTVGSLTGHPLPSKSLLDS